MKTKTIRIEARSGDLVINLKERSSEHADLEYLVKQGGQVTITYNHRDEYLRIS